MAAGMGAGIAAIFRAPLAGALFAAEVLYRSPDFESEVIIPAAHRQRHGLLHLRTCISAGRRCSPPRRRDSPIRSILPLMPCWRPG